MKRILIADDDLFYRKMLSKTLEDKGYEIVVESSGWRAYLQLKTAEFDLAILDVYMPEKSGLEVLTLLNTDSEITGRRRIPVIIITGDTAAEMEETLRTLNASSFLIKPITQTELISTIQRFI